VHILRNAWVWFWLLFVAVVGLTRFSPSTSFDPPATVRTNVDTTNIDEAQKRALTMNVGTYNRLPIGKQIDLGVEGAFLRQLGARPSNDAEALYYRCFGQRGQSGRFDNTAVVVLLSQCAADVGIIRPK
jgi:hypothetical protein